METQIRPFKPASVFIFLALSAGILSGYVLPDHTRFLKWVLYSSVLWVFFVFFFKNRWTFQALLLFFIVLGLFLIQARLYPEQPYTHISRYLDTGPQTLTGQVVSFPRQGRYRQRMLLSCQRIEQKGRSVKTSGNIYLTLYGHSDNVLQIGDLIRFTSRIKSPVNFKNPGRFDYERYLRLKDISGNAYADGRKIEIRSDPSDRGLIFSMLAVLQHLRSQFSGFVMTQPDKPAGRQILISLITGQKELVPQAVRDLFSKAGTSHILAISGLHLSIVGFFFYSFFYRILSLSSYLLLSGRARKIAGLLSLLPMLFYILFSGLSPSSIRAFIMAAVLLLSFVSEKEKDFLSSLSVAGILILVLDPGSLFSISFQLSFVAVLFIVYGLTCFKAASYIFKKTLFSRAVMMITVACLAGLGTFPLSAHYFHVISLVQPLSNVIVLPLMGFIALPLGFVSLFLFQVVPLWASFFIRAALLFIDISTEFTRWITAFPFTWIRAADVDWIQIILMYAVMLAGFLYLKNQKKPALILSVMASVTVSILFFHSFFSPTPTQQDLRITVLDVGQGSSTLIRTPGKTHILVDGGGFPDAASFDTGRYLIAPFLWQNRIRQIDYIILSHPESDHLNGLVYIVQNFKVLFLIKNNTVKQSGNYAALMDACRQHQVQILTPPFSQDRLRTGGVELEFIDTNYFTGQIDLNDQSLVFRLLYHRFSMLFTGDILHSREKRLSLADRTRIASQVLLAPHHGSATSSRDFFLDKVEPKSVIVSCGRNNRYGFPSPIVLNRYRDRKIRIFRTDKDGAVTITTTGGNYNISTYKGG